MSSNLKILFNQSVNQGGILEENATFSDEIARLKYYLPKVALGTLPVKKPWTVLSFCQMRLVRG